MFALAPDRPFEWIGRVYDFHTKILPAVAATMGGAGLALGRSHSIRRRAALAGWIVLAVVLTATRTWATHIEPQWLRVRSAFVPARGTLPRSLRILHFSDVQANAVDAYEGRVFERMRALEPDLIVFTGDLFQPVPPVTFDAQLRALGPLMASLQARLGKFVVLGDVDPPELAAHFASWGFRLLDGEGATITGPDGTRIELLGLPVAASRGWRAARPLVERWLASTDPAAVRLVLGHGPDFALEVRDLPIDLCLAGHTHGGQVRVPLLGSLVTLSRVPRAWARGARPIGAAWLNVSAGIGCEHVPGLPDIRFACPPEVTWIELASASDAGARDQRRGTGRVGR